MPKTLLEWAWLSVGLVSEVPMAQMDGREPRGEDIIDEQAAKVYKKARVCI